MAENQNKEYRHLVRIADTDIEGKKHLLYGLTKIKGVNVMYANAACKVAGIPITKRISDLSDAETKKLDEVVRNPLKNGFPNWMINRRKDYETGEDLHIISGDVKFVKDQDIKRLRKIKSYKGMRHGVGLTVRGQKTKSNFRKNKGKAMGVKRKKGGKTGK